MNTTKDSKSYLEDLETWKNSIINKNSIVSTVYVIKLYPSLSISLVTKALTESLKSCSYFDEFMIYQVFKLCELALRNNLYNSRKSTINKSTVLSQETSTQSP